MNKTRCSRILLVTFLLAAPSARAQWQPDGVGACVDPVDQVGVAVTYDGSGGAIVTWHDAHGGLGMPDIYSQRISVSGSAMWTTNGVPICNAAGSQNDPAIISDGSGGAIMAWMDGRADAGNIYAQRVNASGVPQWTANGVAVCTAAGIQEYVKLASDGAGGAIVVWHDIRPATNNVYTQRVNASGVVQWAANGIAVASNPLAQTLPSVVSDGVGGAIIAWLDLRNGPGYDLYAQRVNASGVSQWTAGGVAVCVAPGNQSSPTPVPMLADGAGGVFLAWQDARLDAGDIYAQHLSSFGTMLWIANGSPLCTQPNGQNFPTLAPDGTGGVIIAWNDGRGVDQDIYAQRLGSTGLWTWNANGVPLCTATGDQWYPQIVSDGLGGAAVLWQDNRAGNQDMYAQRVNGQGVSQWTPNGVVMCAAAGDQLYPVVAASGAGMVASWDDGRYGNPDIYVQRLDFRYGHIGHPEPSITSVADIRGDQGGKVKVNWTSSDLDVLNNRTITHYSVWRGTDVGALMAASSASVVSDPSRITADFRGKAVWKQHAQATDYYWEWVGNQDAIYQHSCTFSASTRADSTSQGLAQTHFMVLAHTADDFTFWPSNEVAGHSVDNLAPTSPLALTAQRIGYDVHLKWNRVRVSDLKNYAVYRRSTSGVTPIPMNFLTTAGDTVLVDPSAPVTALYYIVTANDVHENKSAPSNEASLAQLTGVGDTPPITALTVSQNYPNPFTNRTEIQVGLPARGDVHIEVFDVSGHRVRAMAVNQAAGWRTISLPGQDTAGRTLASGVYFYRVSAAGATVTKKMIIAR